MSEALKSNTTLTKLDLRGKHKKKEHEPKESIQTLLSIHFTSIVRDFGKYGLKALNEGLESNTTLNALNLEGEDKTKQHTKVFFNKVPLFMYFTFTGSSIRDTGATSLSESLKSNTTLTALNLCGEDKRHPKDIQQQIILFLSFHINRQQNWRKRSNIIE